LKYQHKPETFHRKKTRRRTKETCQEIG